MSSTYLSQLRSLGTLEKVSDSIQKSITYKYSVTRIS